MVDASVWLPEDITIDYLQQKKIVEILEQSIGRKMDLNLRLQRTISIVSQTDRLTEEKKNLLKNTLTDELQKINSSVSIDSLDTNFDEKEQTWVVYAVFRGDPSINMTQRQQESLQNLLAEKVKNKVNLNIEIVSRVRLQSNPEIENQQIIKELQNLIHALSEDIDISSINLKTIQLTPIPGAETTARKIITADIELKVAKEYPLPLEAFETIKKILDNKFKANFFLTVNTLEKQTFEF